MPAQLTILEKLAFRLQVAPVPVLDYIGALGLHAVCIGERLGVFETLRKGSMSAQELAAKLQANERGVCALLNALDSIGYLRQENGEYSLSSMAAKWTPRLNSGIGFFEWMAFEGWSSIESILQGKETNGSHRPEHLSAPGQEDRIKGTLSNSRLSAEEIAKRVRVPRSARRLLDVGAGLGLYSAKFCEKHPGLRATLVDAPAVLEQARDVMREEGVIDRVQFCPGDFWKDDLGEGFDVTLLFNLLNAFPDGGKINLLRRAASTLSPSGLLVVLDQMRRPALRGTAKAVVDLTNLRLFDPGQSETYSLPELQSWLPAAGLRPVQTGALRAVPWMCFVVARKA